MNWMDIVIGIPIVWGLWRGLREGVILQLGGIAGVILGIWFASKFSRTLGLWLGINPSIAGVAGFIMILVGVLLAIALLGWLMRGLFRISGLGIFDSAGGMLLGGLKMALIMSLLLYGFDMLNKQEEWVSRRTLDTSRFYTPLKNFSGHIFPYVDSVRQRWLDGEEHTERTQEV